MVGGDEGKGKDSILTESVIFFSFFTGSLFICVGESVCVETVDGFSVVGFSGNGWADDGFSGGGS